MSKEQSCNTPDVPIIGYLKGKPIAEISGGAYIADTPVYNRYDVVLEDEADDEAWKQLGYLPNHNVDIDAAADLLMAIRKIQGIEEPDDDETFLF